MHPYRYDGSPGPYQALLERLSVMGNKRERGADAMPGWRDPLPYMAEDQLKAHLVDLQRMAERDKPALHEEDNLQQTMGGLAITGASSTMHSLRGRQEALEILEERAKWLATYLTPERLDLAEQWRDQIARRGVVSRQSADNRMRAHSAKRDMRWTVQFCYEDGEAASDAWFKLIDDERGVGYMEAAKQVAAQPEILGKLRGGKTWLGLGQDNKERQDARDRLAQLPRLAMQQFNHTRLADKAERQLNAMEKPERASGELSETLAAIRDVKKIDLHYMLAMEDKAIRTRALIAGQKDDPVQTMVAADKLYAELMEGYNPGERITAGQLKRGLTFTLNEMRNNPAQRSALEAAGLNPDAVFSDDRKPTPRPGAAPKLDAPAP